MSGRRIDIGRRPAQDSPVTTWIREGEVRSNAPVAPRPDANTARMTVDVTPELRGRIKIAAFRSGQTVADLLRHLLEREFSDQSVSAGTCASPESR
jgi:hypothetical protein